MFRGRNSIDEYYPGEKKLYTGKTFIETPIYRRSKDDLNKIKKETLDSTSLINSLSFGNSLLAGLINDYGDKGACALLYFFKNNFGYAYLLDKHSFIHKNYSNFFFISPFSSLVALFARGEFFHSRTISYDTKEVTSVNGIALEPFIDKIGLLHRHGDPLKWGLQIMKVINDPKYDRILSRDNNNEPFIIEERTFEPAQESEDFYRQLSAIGKWKKKIAKKTSLTPLTTSFTQLKTMLGDFADKLKAIAAS